MKTVLRLLCLAALLGCQSTPSREPAVSEPFPAQANSSLFTSYEPMDLTLAAPFTSIAEVKKSGFWTAKEVKFKGALTYRSKDQKRMKFHVEVKMKGFSTLTICPFPKLELSFPEDNPGTPFAGVKTVDLNTHCSELDDQSVREDYRAAYYNHREVLIYRMLELLEIPTFKARPVFIQYDDIEKNSQAPFNAQKIYSAYLLEDMDDLLSYKKLTEVLEKPDQKRPHQPVFTHFIEAQKVDPEDIYRIALFQSMIGNWDWFIKMDPEHKRTEKDSESFWNVKVVENQQGKWILFPQDFSLSAMATGNFEPQNMRSIYKVVNAEIQQRIQKAFLDKKVELYKMLETLKDDPKGQENARLLLDHFFKKIHN